MMLEDLALACPAPARARTRQQLAGGRSTDELSRPACPIDGGEAHRAGAILVLLNQALLLERKGCVHRGAFE